MSTGSRTSTAAPATVPRRRNDGDLEGPRRQACLRHLPRGRLPRDGRVLMPPAVIRSLLFVPGHDERKIEKALRSEEHTSELQSLMRISYAVFCLKKKNNKHKNYKTQKQTT